MVDIELLKCLSVRPRNVLENYKINTLQQIRKMSDRDLLMLKGMGKRSLSEIRDKFGDQFKFYLKEYDREQRPIILKNRIRSSVVIHRNSGKDILFVIMRTHYGIKFSEISKHTGTSVTSVMRHYYRGVSHILWMADRLRKMRKDK